MNRRRDHWTPGVPVFSRDVSEPLRGVGGLFLMSVDAVRFLFRRPFQAREFLEQSWFVARVALLPTLLVAIPFTILVSFTLNILLRELGAADLSGAGAAFGAVTQIGPLVTVLIVAGAGATSMCADLGSRTIRDEIDALEVMGINPIQRLVTPRMLAGRCRPCDRPRGARIAHRGRVGHAARLAGDLRHKRQLQPVRIGGMA